MAEIAGYQSLPRQPTGCDSWLSPHAQTTTWLRYPHITVRQVARVLISGHGSSGLPLTCPPVTYSCSTDPVCLKQLQVYLETTKAADNWEGMCTMHM